MTLADSVRSCLRKYATFQGRAPRSEYWFFVLATLLANLAAGLVDGLLMESETGPLEVILMVVIFLPSLAVSVRRLHDTDHSGWWILMWLVPLIGVIVLLIWFCSRGTDGDNRFGPDPLYSAG